MASRSLARFSSLYLPVDRGTYTVTWPVLATNNKKPDLSNLAPRVLLGWVECYSIYPGGRRALHVVSAASSLMHTFWCFRTTNLRASGSCLQGRCSWSTSTEPVGVSMCLLCCAWQHPGIDHSQNPYRRRAKQCTVLLPAGDPTEAYLCFCLWIIHIHPVFLSIQGSARSTQDSAGGPLWLQDDITMFTPVQCEARTWQHCQGRSWC